MFQAFVFLNRNPAAKLRGLKLGDELHCVHHLTIPNGQETSQAEGILDKVFTLTNHGSPDVDPGYRDRSLSVGDVVTVVVKHQKRILSYECKPNGWEKLEKEWVNNGHYH